MQVWTDNVKVMKHGSHRRQSLWMVPLIYVTITCTYFLHTPEGNIRAAWEGWEAEDGRRRVRWPFRLQREQLYFGLLRFDIAYPASFCLNSSFDAPTVAGTIHHRNGLLKQTSVTQNEAATSSMNVKHTVDERIKSLMDILRCSRYVWSSDLTYALCHRR